MLAGQLPLPKAFAWQALLIQSALLALYQPALPFWNSLLFAALLGWQGWRLWHNSEALTQKQLNLLVAPILVLLLWQWGQLGVFNLMLHILLLAAIARGFTLTLRREAQQLIWVHYFSLACGFIFYQQMALALMIIAVMGLNLYLQHRLSAAEELPLQPKRLSLLFLMVLPIWLGLFLLFPRLPPLWQIPNQNIASSGLSDTLDPGSIEQLVKSDALAFRVRFQSDIPERPDWYWRVKVFEDFDGRSWRINSRFKERAVSSTNFRSEQPRISYQLLVEPTYQRDLFSLGLPLEWSEPLISRPAGLIAYPNLVTQRISYDSTSVLSPIPLASAAEQALNTIQHAANPQSRQFGEQLAQQYQGNGLAIVQAIATHFQQQDFYYSLTPPRLGSNAIDQFLFSSRIGFCSHYASATAVILRAAGIPARVVGGYQGGDWQEQQQYLLVRQRDAHAWVEFLDNGQWLRFDPTAAIAPERILQGIEQTLNSNDRALLTGWQSNWLGQLALQWSHLDYFWSMWVLGFKQQEQQELWQKIASWLNWLNWLSIIVLCLALTSITYLLWRYFARKAAKRASLRAVLVDALNNEPALGETVAAWLKHKAQQNPEAAALLEELGELYQRSVFANDQQAAIALRKRIKQQQRQLKQLKP
ncbi:transglutaminaseTgpA domain-containing protein [Alishewanella sp. d11]|uniref:transglutaminase family protein n=1 Tax=Alishewanella sp. d11 TaxID=3414030 RepID=UPI003BF797F5